MIEFSTLLCSVQLELGFMVYLKYKDGRDNKVSTKHSNSSKSNYSSS